MGGEFWLPPITRSLHYARNGSKLTLTTPSILISIIVIFLSAELKISQGEKMAKYTLIISLVVGVLNFQALGAAWYTENFDKFKNGDIVGQDDWEIAMNQKTNAQDISAGLDNYV